MLLLTACGSSGPGGPGGAGGMPPTQVETAKVQPQPLSDQFETVGTLRAEESVVIRPEVDGKIQTIHFTEGQQVAAGALLFTLDPALTQAALNEANANLENSRRADARASELVGKQLISRSDADSAKAALGVDQARAASARTRLEKTQIRAPFAGVVGLRGVSAGDYVSTGQALVDLVRMDSLQLEFRVPEVQLGKLKVGQSVVFGVDAFPGEPFKGTIVAIAPTIDLASRSAALRARVDNSDFRLRPGLSARLQLVFATKPDALLVPEQAIWPNGDQKMVYVVRDGIAKLVPVTLGARQPGLVEVTEGLKAGDEVVTSGQQKLQDGAKVATAAAAPAAH
jgi:membrane fusion protein (multidrug efflux system)